MVCGLHFVVVLSEELVVVVQALVSLRPEVSVVRRAGIISAAQKLRQFRAHRGSIRVAHLTGRSTTVGHALLTRLPSSLSFAISLLLACKSDSFES